MSHCPGTSLEDWITDWYRVVDDEHGTLIRRFYEGQYILNKEQFAELVKILEPLRDHVENLLWRYSEEEDGSYRDYCGNFNIPDEINDAAWSYIKSLNVNRTPGIVG